MHSGTHILTAISVLALLAGCPAPCPDGYERVNGPCQSVAPDDDDDSSASGDDDDTAPDDDDTTDDDDDATDDDDDATDDDDDATDDDDDDATPPEPVLSVSGRHFQDADGGTVILRGVNVAGNSKVPPFVPFTDSSELDALPPLGFNSIRLLFTWEAYEPTEGVYDEAYLDAITTIADAAWDRGLYVIVDFHQDGFSRFHAGGCGDGFPEWAAHAGASLDTPDNGPGCSNWGVQVAADPDVHDSFEAMYGDTDGVRTRLMALWDRLAEHFSDHPGVVGYDLMNEPWGWEESELGPLYEEIATVVRAQHPGAVLFIEGHASTNNGVVQTLLPTPTFANFAYAPHFYETAVITTHIFSGLPTATDIGFLTMSGKANDWGVPLMLGEFGTHGDTFGAAGYVALQYERLDEYLASGMQWNWTPAWNETDLDGWNDEDLAVTDPSGAVRPNFAIRPQPRRFAGVPSAFEVTDDEVTATWTHDPGLDDTVLFVPASAWWDTASVDVAAPASLTCSYDAGARLVTCSGTAAGEVSIEITPG
ncbi:MAG: glycoside hydrolase family 5 protein [Proteobacteria bacterium]|nr:glycoside hydrolase family 5 protein [Pseudomonadota bacterium]